VHIKTTVTQNNDILEVLNAYEFN